MLDELCFGIQKLLREIRHFDFYFAIFVFELIADKLPLLSGRENVIIIAGNNDFVDGFGVGLNLIDFFG